MAPRRHIYIDASLSAGPYDDVAAILDVAALHHEYQSTEKLRLQSAVSYCLSFTYSHTYG